MATDHSFSPKALANLHKHSIDLYVRVAELVLQSEMRMIQAGATAFNRHKSIAPQSFRAFLPDAKAQPANWFKAPWEQMQQQSEMVQALTQDCLDIHKDLGEEIKQAVAAWHREALDMVKGEPHPADAMQKYMSQYFQFFAPKKD